MLSAGYETNPNYLGIAGLRGSWAGSIIEHEDRSEIAKNKPTETPPEPTKLPNEAK